MSPGELYRPHYHFSPPANWMNDPNGLVYSEGVYHLFYQYHPGSAMWGPMHWGHAASYDLVNWKHLPIALYPDENGMIFSGSAVVDWNNTAGFGERALIAIFTYSKAHIETQNLAYSTDKGHTWTKYAGNPVIPHPGHLHDFRDPKVFWHEDHWVMLLAAGDTVLFYISSDLRLEKLGAKRKFWQWIRLH
jgi:fructan beta-fructosidase